MLGEGSGVDHWVFYVDVRISIVVLTVEWECALVISNVLRILNKHFSFLKSRYELRLA